MKEPIQIYQNEQFGAIRTIEENGKVLFCGKDIAIALGYSDPKKAINQHCKDDGVAIYPLIDNIGREQQAKFITEGNLYRLITHSKLPTAEKFEKWVFDEVLPSIRKTGGYTNNIEEMITKTATAVATEVIKQLMPVLRETIFPSDTINDLRYAEIAAPKPRRKRAPCIISKLDDEIRKNVDEMLLTDRYSYADVQDYLSNFGIHISQTSIYRYVKRFHY